MDRTDEQAERTAESADRKYHRFRAMGQEELNDALIYGKNAVDLLFAAREMILRLCDKAALQEARIAELEKKRGNGKSGRKRHPFIYRGQILDDGLLTELVDGDILTVRELEKEVGASKNTLRNRYKRAKRKAELERMQGKAAAL